MLCFPFGGIRMTDQRDTDGFDDPREAPGGDSLGRPRLGFPVRLGWIALAAQRDQHAHGSTVTYQGVERLYSSADPREVERELRGPRAAWAAAWKRYWELDLDQVSDDYAVVAETCLAFVRVGVRVEPVFFRLEWAPSADELSDVGKKLLAELEDCLRSMVKPARRSDRAMDEGLRFLGFDATLPIPSFHSLIQNPGLDREVPDFPLALNGHGLLDSFDTAREWCRLANRWDYTNGPFCVVAVYDSPAWEDALLANVRKR